MRRDNSLALPGTAERLNNLIQIMKGLLSSLTSNCCQEIDKGWKNYPYHTIFQEHKKR